MAKIVFKSLNDFVDTCNKVSEKQFNLALDSVYVRVEEEIVFTEGDCHDRS